MPFLIEFEDIEQCFIACHKLNLSFIELNMNLPFFQVNNFDTDLILSLQNKYGIYCTIHMDENFDPFNYNSLLLDAHIATFLRTVDIAKKINAPVINMHLHKGVYFTLPNGKIFLNEKYNNEYNILANNFLEIVNSSLNNKDVVLCIENCGTFENFQISTLHKYLKNNKIKLTFDIGHYGILNNSNVLNLYKRNINAIHHVHLHDYTKKRNHLPLGEGIMDINEDYYDLTYSACRTVIEVKDLLSLEKSLINFRAINNLIKD